MYGSLITDFSISPKLGIIIKRKLFHMVTLLYKPTIEMYSSYIFLGLQRVQLLTWCGCRHWCKVQCTCIRRMCIWQAVRRTFAVGCWTIRRFFLGHEQGTCGWWSRIFQSLRCRPTLINTSRAGWLRLGNQRLYFSTATRVLSSHSP